MKGKLFLFQWDDAGAQVRAKELREVGWDVIVESEDGAQGCKAVRASLPDVVVMDLARRPSHSRETVESLRELKATRPIVFVDGMEEVLVKTKAKIPEAIYTTSAKLQAVLEKIAKSAGKG